MDSIENKKTVSKGQAKKFLIRRKQSQPLEKKEIQVEKIKPAIAPIKIPVKSISSLNKDAKNVIVQPAPKKVEPKPVIQMQFKGSIVTPYGEIKEFENEKQYNNEIDYYKFINKAPNKLYKFFEFLKAYGKELKGQWKLNGNSVHFILANYRKTELWTKDYTAASLDNIVKSLLIPIKKYFVKWEVYKTVVEDLVEHEYRNIERESTKDKTWHTFCIDIQFKSEKIASEFVKLCIKNNIDIRGYSQLKIVPDGIAD